MNEKLLNNLETLPFFTKTAISAFEHIKPDALNQNIKRWVRDGLLIRLKNGLYVTKTFVDRSMHDPSYIELVAGRLVAPSYTSLEYVLQKRNLLTEATFAVTSVTLKSTRSYTNPFGTFKYHTVAKNLYFGFEARRFGKNVFYEASQAKALFDYLYFHSSSFDPSDLTTIEELRINWSEFGKAELLELMNIAERGGVKKIIQAMNIVKKEIYGDTD